jgi:hypothetical protein
MLLEPRRLRLPQVRQPGLLFSRQFTVSIRRLGCIRQLVKKAAKFLISKGFPFRFVVDG